MSYPEVRQVIYRINQMFIQNSGLRTEDYTVILYLLCVYKQEILKERRGIKEFTHIFNASDYSHWSGILGLKKHFRFAFSCLNKDDLFFIFNSFAELNNNVFSESEFPKTFETVFEVITDSKAFKKGDFITHPNLIDLVLSISAGTYNSVYNPFAAWAGLPLAIKSSNVHYFGQELDESIHRISRLRLYAHRKPDSFIIKREDCYKNWPFLGQFDLVFARLPFLYNTSSSKNKSAESFIIEQCIENLSGNAKLILIVPNRFLWDPAHKENRQKIIDSNFLEKVIRLPTGVFRNTGTAASVLICSKNKSRNEIEIIDISFFLNKYQERGLINWNNVNIKASRESQKDNSELDITQRNHIPNQRIIDNDYLINIRQFQVEKEYSLLQRPLFNNFITITEGDAVEMIIPDKLIDFNNLSEDGIVGELSFSSTKEIPLNNIQENYKIISEDGIFISSINHIRPTYFESKEPVLINNSIFHLKLKDTINYSYDYIIHELSDESVKSQISAIFKGTGKTKLSAEDVLNLRIRNAPKQEQQEKIQSYLEKTIKESREETVLNQKHTKELIQERIDLISHIITTPASNLEYYASTLKEIIQEQIFSKFPEVMSLKRGENGIDTLDQLLDGLQKDARTIVEEINNQTYRHDHNLELEYIDIKEWLETFFSLEIDKNARVKFELNLESLDNQSGLEPFKIKANDSGLRTLFNNILSNIYKHAFQGVEDNHKIELRVTLDQSKSDIENSDEENILSIYISNTGNPWPDNFSLEDFKKLGNRKGKGSGIGGDLINTIVNHFNGSMDVIKLHEKDETGPGDYVTSFVLNFPYSNTPF